MFHLTMGTEQSRCPFVTSISRLNPSCSCNLDFRLAGLVGGVVIEF